MFKPTKLIPLFLGVFLIWSCSDDDKEITPEDELPTEFSEFTVEQNKTNLEDNGLALVNDIRDLKSSAGIKTTISFNHFLSMSDLPETESGRKVTSLQPLDLIRSLAEFGQGKISATEVLSGFRSKETDPETAQEIFDTYEGVFTYSAGENTWTHVASDDGKITFRFPSTENGTANDAEFVIYGYTSVQVNNVEAEYTGDLPTALKADLTVNDTKQIGYSLAASYKANGEPTSVETSLTINAFKFAFKVENTTEEVSVDYSLTYENENLLSLGAGAGGNFASSNIDQSEGPGDVLNTATAYFQIVNIKFAGEVDVKTLDNALAGDLTIEQEADAWNANATMVVFYADTKKKIADTEFYGFEDTDTYTSCWDINGDGVQEPNECIEDTYVEESIDIRLIFADGSKSDMETYTDVGFEDIQDELETFMDELEEDLD